MAGRKVEARVEGAAKIPGSSLSQLPPLPTTQGRPRLLSSFSKCSRDLHFSTVDLGCVFGGWAALGRRICVQEDGIARETGPQSEK